MEYWAPYNGPSESIYSNDSYVDGDIDLGIEGSIPTGQGFEQTMRELVNLVVKSGITPSDVINGIQVAQAVQSHRINYGVDTGGSDTLATTLDPTPYALNNGLFVNVKKGGSSNVTTTPTLNVNGLGPREIIWNDGTPVQPNDLPANSFLSFLYDGVRGKWILLSLNINIISYMAQTIGINTVIYYTEGSSGYFVVPAGVYVLREVEVVGAGGGGGGAGSPMWVGGGGNAGSVVRGPMLVSPGQQLYYYIGVGGYGGSSAYDGGGGGDTYFDIWRAAGGNGGRSDSNPGGATRPSSGGEEQYPGGQGDGGRQFAAAGPTVCWGGRGGASVAGGFGGNGAVDSGTNGNPGVYPGGGGGGGAGSGAGYHDGGRGAGGRVLIRY